MGCHADLCCWNLEGFGKFCYQGLSQHLFVGKGHEWIHEMHLFFFQRLYVVLDIFRIGGDHGAVIVVACLRAFIALIGDAGVEDKLHALSDEP